MASRLILQKKKEHCINRNKSLHIVSEQVGLHVIMLPICCIMGAASAYVYYLVAADPTPLFCVHPSV